MDAGGVGGQSGLTGWGAMEGDSNPMSSMYFFEGQLLLLENVKSLSEEVKIQWIPVA